tara:strand:+ start:2239 stop:4047 length:1809 start_codon:yes stop_codon:yes gene_type:complete
MPKPTNANKDHFKTVLRKYRKKFDSNIQTVKYSDLKDMFDHISTSSAFTNVITDNTDVHVVLFDGNEGDAAIDITSLMAVGKFIYFPAFVGDYINLKIGGGYEQIRFASDNYFQLKQGTGYTGAYGLNSDFYLSTKSTTGKGSIRNYCRSSAIGGFLIQVTQSQTIEITTPANDITINENGTATFGVTTTGYGNGDTIPYKIEGDGLNSIDPVNDFTSNMGGIKNMTVNNNAASVTVTLKDDYTVNEGLEHFYFHIVDSTNINLVLGSSPKISVTDTSTGSYTLALSPTPVNEATSSTWTVNTTGVPNGYTLYYTVEGTAATNADIESLNGSFQINNNTGTITIPIRQDFVVDNAETLIVKLRQNSITGIVLGVWNTVTVNNVAWSLSITPNKTTVNESSASTSESVTFTIATSGVPDGTKVRLYPQYVTGNSAIFSDVSTNSTNPEFNAVSYVEVTINNNAATQTLYIGRDGLTEGSEVFNVAVKDFLETTTIATSPNITITDTSFIGSQKTDKTFGPLAVNRDGGNANNVSDWYTICGLDKLPNGSKVAVFIDASGSMTMNTIQASHDLLMQKLNARNMDVIVVTNPSEDWITPFQQILN